MYKGYLKVLIDFFLALEGLLVSLPLTLPLALLLSFSNRGNPFFVQARPGKNSRVFKLLKFKTMNDRKDATGKLLPDKDRLTPVGLFIRSTSMDRKPQFSPYSIRYSFYTN